MKKIIQSDINKTHLWTQKQLELKKVPHSVIDNITDNYDYLLKNLMDEIKKMKTKKTKVVIECGDGICRGSHSD